MNALLDSAGTWLPGIAAMALLTVGSAFFSSSETAMFYLSREELRQLQSGRAAERLTATLMRNPDRLLTVILFWNLVINLSYFAVSLSVAKRLIDEGQHTAAGLLSVLGLVAIILLGEVFPKSLAVLFRRRLAVLAGLPLAIAARVLDPLLPALGALTAALRRVFFPHLTLEPYLEVDDIERAVETSELGIELARLEQQILGRILQVSDMSAEEIMRPRGTYQVWRPPVHLDDLRRRAPIPEFLLISGEDGDTVSGSLDLYEATGLPERHLEAVAESVVFVPWCATVSDTLAQLRSNLVSVASVINEYGETVGIITEEDILDTILNPHSSRGRRILEREPVSFTEEGQVFADGLVTLRYLASRLGIDHEIEEDAPLTVVGLLHDMLERFPQQGDECSWEGFLLRVVHAGEPGDAVRVQIIPPDGGPFSPPA